jgi:competence protein ComEA
MRRQDGLILLVFVLLGLLAAYHGRVVSFAEEDSPAFCLQREGEITVFLGKGFPDPGVYRFFDGATPRFVIQMAGMAVAAGIPSTDRPRLPLLSGEALEVSWKDNQVVGIKRKFMPAGQRMALGIALHPDRMNETDWQALPGIGPVLAKRIVLERQKNGDFGCLEAVQRVKGVGPGLAARWKTFF